VAFWNRDRTDLASSAPGEARTTTLSLRPLFLIGTLILAAMVGCDSGDDSELRTPSANEVAAYYRAAGDFSVEMSGNVAQLTATIDRDTYLMGGELWARASPYIFLFSSATQAAMSEHPGLGGIRMIVRYRDGSMVAQAMLDRTTMPAGRWSQALAVSARARSEGSERPGFMRDLVRWGEDHTHFEYNPEYISVP